MIQLITVDANLVFGYIQNPKSSFRWKSPQCPSTKVVLPGDICGVFQCLVISQGEFSNTDIYFNLLKHVRDDIWYEPSKQSIENLFFSHSNKIRAKHLPHMPDLIASDIILFS